MDLREHVPLAQYTTFQIGGPARYFVEAATEDEIIEAVQFARQCGLPLFVLGGGSNLLVRETGFPGLVLRVATTGIVEMPSSGHNTRVFSVAAGESWDRFVSFAVEQGCGGVECLAGIPGTVGGTPIQNVGAYGQEVSSTITSVQALDLATLEVLNLPSKECGFRYRSSIFNTTQRGRYLVIQVGFKLPIGVNAAVEYKDLKQYFKDWSDAPTVVDVAAAVREVRRAKGMLLVPGEPDSRSAGSFFKNPVLNLEQFAFVAEASGIAQEAIPQFPAGAERVKVPAAWLLEHAGFHKGDRLGAAGISSRHTLALINADGATANDILALRDRIVTRVHSRFGIVLEMEPVLVG